MKQNFYLPFFSVTIIFHLSMCRQNDATVHNMQSSELVKTDTIQNQNLCETISIKQAFTMAKTDKTFLKDLGLQEEKQYKLNSDSISILPGDLNGDGSTDAVVLFGIEGRGAGNNWDAHYAAFLNKGRHWQYQGQLDAGGDMAERLIQLKEIKNGKISGVLVGNKDESLPEISIQYVLNKGQFINTYTALHQTGSAEREYIALENIITPSGKILPLSGTLNEYGNILGKGRILTPAEQPECGTIFEEGAYRELYFDKQLKFELNDKNNVAWSSVLMKGAGYQLNTDKGTITESTTLDELKAIFYKQDSWQILDDGKNGIIFCIPNGLKSDNQLRMRFSKNGKLEIVYLFIPC